MTAFIKIYLFLTQEFQYVAQVYFKRKAILLFREPLVLGLLA